MNFLASDAFPLTLVLIFIVLAFFISGWCAYYSFRTGTLFKNLQARFHQSEADIIRLTKNMGIYQTLNNALLNSCQAKNNIDICSILLDGCTNKSDVLTAKAIENSLHFEINNALEAIAGIEKKRAFLEAKIKEAFKELELKTTAAELDQTLIYAQVLAEETQGEFNNTEKLKNDVLKVNQVLDKVLLQI